jgi:hypothetical protein
MICLILGAGLTSAPAVADVIFDTFPYLEGCGGYAITGPTNIYTHSDNDVAVYVDVPAGADYWLESVEIPLCRWRGSDVVHVYLMSDNGGSPSLPQAVLDSSLTQTLPNTFEVGVIQAVFSGTTQLQGGTRYWIACSSPADAYTAWAQGEDNDGFFAGRTNMGPWLQNHSTLMPAVRVQGSSTASGAGDAATTSSLQQNIPNPFNPTTTIAFSLERSCGVSLRIYDAGGGLVRTLVDGAREARNYEVTWDGRDDLGRTVASGVYFYRLTAGSFTQARKMVLLK